MEPDILRAYLRAHSKDQLTELIEAATAELMTRDTNAWTNGPPPPSVPLYSTARTMDTAALQLPPVGSPPKQRQPLMPPLSDDDEQHASEEVSLFVNNLCTEDDWYSKNEVLFKTLRQEILYALRPLRAYVFVPKEGGWAKVTLENMKLAKRAFLLLSTKYSRVSFDQYAAAQ